MINEYEEDMYEEETVNSVTWLLVINQQIDTFSLFESS